MSAQTTRESWPSDTPFLSWRKWKVTFCDQTTCWFYGCELFSSKGSLVTVDPYFWSREKLQSLFCHFSYDQIQGTWIGKLWGEVDPPIPYSSRGENENTPSVAKLCVCFSTANYLAPRVVWSYLTLVFGRERISKKFYKSFLHIFVWANTGPKFTNCEGKLTHQYPIFSSRK